MTDLDISKELEFIVDSLIKQFPHTVTGVMTGEFNATIIDDNDGSYIVIDYNGSQLPTKNYMAELYYTVNLRKCDTG